MSNADRIDLVSMIILSYRNIEGIYDTLNSVMDQTYPAMEIIISDDGTPEFDKYSDSILNHIENMKRTNIKNVKIHTMKVNQGTVKNINSAIRMASGKYIKVLAAEDCFACKEALEKYVDYMKESAFLIAFAKMRGVTPEGEYRDELLACESDYNLLKNYTVEETKNRLFKRNFLPAPAWIAERKLFEEYGLFREDTRLIEDYPYWIYLTLHQVEFGYIDQVLVSYRLSGVSSAGSYSEMFMRDMVVIYDKYIFPYDKRFGIFQPIYNQLKKMGLNFYIAKAKWDKLSVMQKVVSGIIYSPFFVYVEFQKLHVDLKNKRTKGKR